MLILLINALSNRIKVFKTVKIDIAGENLSFLKNNNAQTTDVNKNVWFYDLHLANAYYYKSSRDKINSHLFSRIVTHLWFIFSLAALSYDEWHLAIQRWFHIIISQSNGQVRIMRFCSHLQTAIIPPHVIVVSSKIFGIYLELLPFFSPFY